MNPRLALRHQGIQPKVTLAVQAHLLAPQLGRPPEFSGVVVVVAVVVVVVVVVGVAVAVAVVVVVAVVVLVVVVLLVVVVVVVAVVVMVVGTASAAKTCRFSRRLIEHRAISR